MEPKEVLEFAKENNAVMVDLKFMDFPGMWQISVCLCMNWRKIHLKKGLGLMDHRFVVGSR